MIRTIHTFFLQGHQGLVHSGFLAYLVAVDA